MTEDVLDKWADRLHAQSNCDDWQFRVQALLTIFHAESRSVRELLCAYRTRFPADSSANRVHFLERLIDSE
jgi:hypothetical protein